MDEIICYLSPLNVGIVAIIGLMTPGFIVKLFPQLQPQAQLTKGSRQGKGETVTEESERPFAKCRPGALVHGPLFTIIDALVRIRRGARPWPAFAARVSYLTKLFFIDSCGLLLTAVLHQFALTFQAELAYWETCPRKRFRFAVNGAISSIIVALLAIDGFNDDRLLVVASAALMLFGFLSIPRRPDRVLKGRPVDRQYTGSLFELATFCWSRGIFDQKSISALSGVGGLPVLGSRISAERLTQHHISQASRSRQGLKPVLAKSYAGALATEWALTILKSTVSLTPRFVIFRLLDRLATPSHGVDVQGLYLALSVGLCKAFELWVTRCCAG